MAQPGMTFTDYVNMTRQNEVTTIQQEIQRAAAVAPIIPPEVPVGSLQVQAMHQAPPGYQDAVPTVLTMGAQPAPLIQPVAQPMMSSAPMMSTAPLQAPATSAAPVAATPGYMYQPQFGMIPVPPEAMASNCSTEVGEDTTTALVTITFRPKKMSDDDKELMEKIVAEKIESDAKKSVEEKKTDDKERLQEEADFWDEAVKKNTEIYLNKINCEATYIYEPEVKPDNSGVRVYQVEIKKKDGGSLKDDLKDLSTLNEFVKIIPVIRKKEKYPEVVFNASIRLGDCTCERHLQARSLTDKANAAQMAVVKALAKVEELTKPTVEAQAAMSEKEAELKRAEVTLASWNKYKELVKEKPEELAKASEETAQATANKATAAAELEKATKEYEEKLSGLRLAKQEVVAAEFDVQQAVDKADKVRKDVPATCELFASGAAYMCSNGCGYSGSKADVAEHEEACDIEYCCDAPGCGYKGNWEDTQKHERECPLLQAVNSSFGFAGVQQPQGVPLFQAPAMSAPVMSAPVASFAAPMAYAAPMTSFPAAYSYPSNVNAAYPYTQTVR